MTTAQYQKTLQRELSQLNRKIDMLIIKGQSYALEARKHKILTRQLRALSGQSFFSRLSHSLSF